MRVSFDLDGTITKHPEFFVALGKALLAAGHTVYILTGIDLATFRGRRCEKYPCLLKVGWYSAVITADSYNDSERALAQLVVAGKMDNHILVGIFKRRVCAELDIAMHFDDDTTHVRLKGAVPVMGVE